MDHNKTPIIETRSLGFTYRATSVVKDVSMWLPRGGVGALIGANGSGKSTLIRLLAGLLTPSTGEVFVDGIPLASMALRERAKRIAYVSQTTAMVFPFTAIEVVLTGRSPFTGRFGFESIDDEEIALAALASLDAAHLAHRPVTELSGGERQLVTVARALAQQPDVMLLDEPASSLDLKHRTQLAHALHRVSRERGIAALIITHDLMLLDSRVDLILTMKCGRITSIGPTEMVLVEHVLSDIYDVCVKTERSRNRTFVWSEL